jgi:hypothetical protein
MSQKAKKPVMTSSQIVTLFAIIVAVILAAYSAISGNVLLAAISVGALGGIVHEVAQSNGKVIVPKPGENSGDVYLGGLFGLIAGAMAGLLVAQGLPSSAAITNSWLSEFFLARLGLKGFSEAVATKRPK